MGSFDVLTVSRRMGCMRPIELNVDDPTVRTLLGLGQTPFSTRRGALYRSTLRQYNAETTW